MKRVPACARELPLMPAVSAPPLSVTDGGRKVGKPVAYFPGFLRAGCFGGSDRACSMPMSTHRERSSSLARSSGPTRSQPGISRPCITATAAPVVATRPG